MVKGILRSNNWCLSILIFIFILIIQTIDPSKILALYVKVDKGVIYYNVAGDGPPTVLIHGLMASSNYWEKVFGPLSRYGKVFALDMPGYGRSGKVESGGYGIDDLVKYLDSYVDTMGLRKVNLVGHSMGGIVAIKYAFLHPNKVERIVIVGSPFYPRPLPIYFKLLNVPILGRGFFWLATRPLGRFYLKKAFFNEEKMEDPFLKDLKMASYSAVVSSMRSIQSTDLRPGLSGLKHPVLIIWGNEDRFVPVSIGKELHKEIKGSRIVIFDRCGHCPMIEWPQRFCHEVKTFLFSNRDDFKR
jgi:pimeloyl-ACP methyl ester carboxylesterase